MELLTDLVAHNSGSTPSDRTEISATNYRLSRSIRVPDFVRLRLYLDANFYRVRSRVDLIVELKKQIQWLSDVKERLDEVDGLMAGSYRA